MRTFRSLQLAFLVAFLIGCQDVLAGKKSPTVIDSPLLTSKITAKKTIIVDLDGEGAFDSVQDAIDSVPENNSEWIIIHVRAGTYREKVTIPENKPFIFLRGNGKGKSKIIWSDSAAKNSSAESATFSVFAPNFIAWGLGFKNDAPSGYTGTPFNQSIAVVVGGDKSAFYRCGFYSTHNTLFDHRGRHYYDNCYIQGSIDFIFGRGQSVFHSCEIFVTPDKRYKIHGSITAQNRQSDDEKSGFVFWKGKVYGIGYVFLGRARGAHSRVIFAKTYLSKTVVPNGWSNWSFDGSPEHITYGEHHCFGPGSNSTGRVSWSRQLTKEEIAPFMGVDFIDGKEWLPIYNED